MSAYKLKNLFVNLFFHVRLFTFFTQRNYGYNLASMFQGVALTTLSRRKPVSDALQSECLEQANTHVQASAESLLLLLGIFTNRL